MKKSVRKELRRMAKKNADLLPLVESVLIKSDGGKTYSPPESVQAAAKRALEWIKDGKAGDGFTDVGRARAAQLARGDSVSYDTIKRIKAYFDRHQPDRDADQFDSTSDPSPGRVAWDAWGGSAAWKWATGIVNSVEGNKKD